MQTPLSRHGFIASVALAALACAKAPLPEGSEVSSSLSRNTSPAVLPSDAAQLVSDNNSFAFDLYHQALAGDETDNFFYSPYSISLALAMTYAGAHGDTATQLATALHFNLAPEILNPAFDALDLSLGADSGETADAFKLSIADSLWGDRATTFQAPFLDTLAVDYGAGVRTVDFLHAAETARAEINNWVSDKTSGKIAQLLPEGSVDDTTKFVLVDAIYFKAGWSTPFEVSLTAPETFTQLDGTAVQANEMHESASLNYAAGTNYQAVELSYSGERVSMVIVLPAAGQFASVEGALSSDLIASITSSLTSNMVQLSMPKFTIQGSTISLKEELTALGMIDAFDPNSADFTSMISAAEGPIWIGDVLHQAFVSVDESGTEAAAATGVTGVGAVGLPTGPTIVDINRPFLFFIRDIASNTILFAGRVLEPQ